MDLTLTVIIEDVKSMNENAQLTYFFPIFALKVIRLSHEFTSHFFMFSYIALNRF